MPVSHDNHSSNHNARLAAAAVEQLTEFVFSIQGSSLLTAKYKEAEQVSPSDDGTLKLPGLIISPTLERGGAEIQVLTIVMDTSTASDNVQFIHGKFSQVINHLAWT